MNIPITRYEVVEVQIPNGTTLTQFNFPDMPNLRNAKILAIDYLPFDIINKSPNTGSELLTFVDSQQCFLNIYQGDLQRIKNMPIVSANQLTVSGGSMINSFNQLRFNGIVISWTKCFLKFITSPATDNVVVSFGVTYVQPEDAEYQYLGQNL